MGCFSWWGRSNSNLRRLSQRITFRPLCRSGHSPALEPRILRMHVLAGLWGAHGAVSTAPQPPFGIAIGRSFRSNYVMAGLVPAIHVFI